MGLLGTGCDGLAVSAMGPGGCGGHMCAAYLPSLPEVLSDSQALILTPVFWHFPEQPVALPSHCWGTKDWRTPDLTMWDKD